VSVPPGLFQVLLSTHLDGSEAPANGRVRLRPDEGVVLAPSPTPANS
jgi:hypothetical protein